MPDKLLPSIPTQRYIILDSLRGFALLGICLANFSEFSLYTFQRQEVIEAMPTAGIDRIVKFIQYLLVDGKFYTIFSILFGIGFSIIISNAIEKNKNGFSVFYRRMGILILIGLFHLLFLWAGDILLLYGVVGLFLPLFRKISNKKLLIISAVLLLFPVLIDSLTALFGWNLSAPAISANQYFNNLTGVNEENFPVWLAQGQSYLDIIRFNLPGSFIRMQEFIEGNRVFKVLGLFLLGFYIGRNKFYAHLEENRINLKKIRNYSFFIGFPLSALYAWNAVNGYPFGLAGTSLLYTFSVFPFSFAYIAAVCLWYIHDKENSFFFILAHPGRMALTNYIGQSIAGIIIFYGIGFGLGAKVGLVYVEIIALGVYFIQIIFSMAWLYYFRFGPIEWIWRMLTYCKTLRLVKIK